MKTETSRSARVEIIAHRGASFDAPENTLAAIELAWHQQADAVEIDVRLTADAEIVVIHDETTARHGGRDTPVCEESLTELRQIDVGRWKGSQWAGERIPTLAEVLETVPDGKRLFVEIKCRAEIVAALSRLEHPEFLSREDRSDRHALGDDEGSQAFLTGIRSLLGLFPETLPGSLDG